MIDRDLILDVPLTSLFRPEIALTLQQVLRIYTVGNLLEAWNSPRQQRRIEQLFDSPDQAQHALSVCFAWMGTQPPVTMQVQQSPWLNGVVHLQVPVRNDADMDG